MRIVDYLTLASHGRLRSFEAASILFTASAVTALCFFGSILTTIHSEKAKPCELAVTAPNYMAITEQSVQDFRAITDVVNVTGIVEIPTTAVSGKYTASLTLIGINKEYLDDLVYTTGGLFPASSAMPWIIMSEASAQLFTDPKDKTKHGVDYMPDIGWLEAEFSLNMDGSTISARVSGLFEGDEPVAYISQDIAKTLQQIRRHADHYTGARVRVANMGAAESISEAISSLGYEVTNQDSAQHEVWKSQTHEAVYLAALAVAGFLCSFLLYLTGKALTREEDCRRDDVLRWAGMSDTAIQGINILRGILLALLGIAHGIAAHYIITAFSTL